MGGSVVFAFTRTSSNTSLVAMHASLVLCATSVMTTTPMQCKKSERHGRDGRSSGPRPNLINFISRLTRPLHSLAHHFGTVGELLPPSPTIDLSVSGFLIVYFCTANPVC